MFNNSGVRKVTGAAPVQILANVQLQHSVGVVVAQGSTQAGADGRKIIKAGTPLAGNLSARVTPFTVAADSPTPTKGVYTVQITVAASVGDKITIEGVVYECAAEEAVATKKFAGSTAAEQVTSLLKMVVCADFDVAAVSGATDKIGFTQKVPDATNTPTATVTQAVEGTMTIGDVAQVTEPVVGTSNDAVGVLLHDVDVTAGNTNGTLLIFGFVNLNRLDAATRALITEEAQEALPMIKFYAC